MTILIPLRALLFILYTAAILGGAFGISYAVFEWREDDGGSASDTTLESLDERIVKLDGRIDTVSSRVSGLGQFGGSTDSTACHNAIIELIMVGLQAQAGEISGGAYEQRWDEVMADIQVHC